MLFKLAWLLIGTVISSVLWAQADYSVGAGRVTLNSPIITVGAGVAPVSHIVNFPPGAFSTTPAVFILPSNDNPDPATLRVHSVTTTGFEVFVSESEGEDNLVHPDTDFDYLAIEPGTYTFSGIQVEVGLETVTAFQAALIGGDSFQTVNLTTGFGSAPVVVTELQTLNSDTSLLSGPGSTFGRNTEPFLELIMGTIGAGSFTVALERAETTAGAIAPGGETVGWIAITDQADTNFNNDAGVAVELRAFFSPDSITGNCTTVTLASGGVSNFSNANNRFIGSQLGRDGNNGGWLRQCDSDANSIDLQIEEDRANDAEQNHTTEQSTLIGFSDTFQTSVADADSPAVNMLLASDTVPAASGANPTVSLSPVNVSFTSLFGGNFIAPPVVVPMTTFDGGAPSYVRVWDITASGFMMAQTAPEGTALPADSSVVDFIAVVPGIVHQLPDGTEIEAQTLSTVNCIGSASACAGVFISQSFSATFSDPAVLAAPQTINNDPTFDPANVANPFLEIAMENQNAAGFDITLDFSQTNIGSPPALNETIGWIAMDGGGVGTLRAGENSTGTGNHVIQYRTIATPVNINGVDDGAGCFSNSFPAAFTGTSSPVSVATENSRNGGDGGWLRRCALSGTAIGLVIDEDQNTDTERSHGGTEEGGVIAFSDTFAWSPATYSHMKLGLAESDPFNGTVNPKSVPGALQRYTLTIQALSRVGIDSGLEIVDPVPANTQLFVGDLDGSGCPVEFNNGLAGNTSGLSFDCNSSLLLLTPAPPAGCTPDPDGFCPFSTFTFADDFDPAIQSIKIVPIGEFAGSNGANTPQFSVEYRVQIL